MSNPWDERVRRMLGPGLAHGGDAAAKTPSLEPQGPESALPGRRIDSASGSVRIIEARYDTAWPYSPRATGELLAASAVSGAAWLKDPRLAGFNRESAVFLDVEATGLFQDANNVAFLVGLAWFQDGEIRVEQLFMDSPEDEPALLERLLWHLDGRQYLVSFNGKSYDKTVLESRFVLNRLMDSPTAHLRLWPHLDLLHLARRIYGGIFPDCKLGTMERRALNFDRGDDVPGALVPQYYFEWLLRGTTAPVLDVIRHNLVDVLTLVHLADHLLTMVDPLHPNADPLIAGNIGSMLLSCGFKAEAIANLKKALPALEGDALVKMALKLEKAMRACKVPKAEQLAIWDYVGARLPEHPSVQIKASRYRPLQ